MNTRRFGGSRGSTSGYWERIPCTTLCHLIVNRGIGTTSHDSPIGARTSRCACGLPSEVHATRAVALGSHQCVWNTPRPNGHHLVSSCATSIAFGQEAAKVG